MICRNKVARVRPENCLPSKQKHIIFLLPVRKSKYVN